MAKEYFEESREILRAASRILNVLEQLEQIDQGDEPETVKKHCRPDLTAWEKQLTCCHCGQSLLDNKLVKQAYKMSNVNEWAKKQLGIVADMAEERGELVLGSKIRYFSGKLLVL